MCQTHVSAQTLTPPKPVDLLDLKRIPENQSSYKQHRKPKENIIQMDNVYYKKLVTWTWSTYSTLRSETTHLGGSTWRARVVNRTVNKLKWVEPPSVVEILSHTKMVSQSLSYISMTEMADALKTMQTNRAYIVLHVVPIPPRHIPEFKNQWIVAHSLEMVEIINDLKTISCQCCCCQNTPRNKLDLEWTPYWRIWLPIHTGDKQCSLHWHVVKWWLFPSHVLR